jgi:hypothetical protein
MKEEIISQQVTGLSIDIGKHYASCWDNKKYKTKNTL